MEFSLSFRKELKKLDVTESMLAMADLMAVGYKAIDAYKICFPENSKLPDTQNKAILDNMLERAKFKKLLDVRTNRVKECAIPVDIEDVNLIDSDEVAKEILRSAKTAPFGSKERAELFMKYDEIRQRKNAAQEYDGTEAINFVFPLKCNQCPMFKAFSEMLHEDKGEIIRPDEMNSIIPVVVAKAYPEALEAYKVLHGKDY